MVTKDSNSKTEEAQLFATFPRKMSTKRELEDYESGSEFSDAEPSEKKAKKTPAVRKTPTKKVSNSLTKKEIDAKIKVATESELKTFLKEILSAHGELLKGSFDAFIPKLMPIIPTSPDDPLLTTCFRCKSSENLRDMAECKICSDCCRALFGNHGTMTRDRVMSNFHFSKTEADNIPHKLTTGGAFKGTIYIYTLAAVLKAVTKKHGSLYMMLKAGH